MKGPWKEILNSDSKSYGGSGQGNLGTVDATPVPYHGRPYSLNLVLPPLSIVYFMKQ
jgi:1,4-alpha-glucan branching enzyme